MQTDGSFVMIFGEYMVCLIICVKMFESAQFVQQGKLGQGKDILCDY